MRCDLFVNIPQQHYQDGTPLGHHATIPVHSNGFSFSLNLHEILYNQLWKFRVVIYTYLNHVCMLICAHLLIILARLENMLIVVITNVYQLEWCITYLTCWVHWKCIVYYFGHYLWFFLIFLYFYLIIGSMVFILWFRVVIKLVIFINYAVFTDFLIRYLIYFL